MRAEGGFQLDVYSESYGGGDLFAEFDAISDLDPDAFEDDLRIQTDEALPGGYVGFRWQPDLFRRYLGVRSELNRENSSTRFEGRWEVGVGRGWTLAADEQFRVQQELDGDENLDLLQAFNGHVERAMAGIGDVRVSILQEHSSVDGDSLSRIYDFDMIGAALRVKRRWGDARGIFLLDIRHRSGSKEYSGDRDKLTATVNVSRFAFESTSYDVNVRGIRRAYDGSGVVSPSDVEGEVTARVSHPIGDTWRVISDTRYTSLVFDDPDGVYFDTLDGMVDARVAHDIGALTAEGGLVGEWYRPQTSAGRAYDLGEVVVKGGYFGGAGLWLDLEERVGFRNYHGAAGVSGPTSLSFTSTDFRYSELSLLLGARWGSLTADVFGQYTVEMHDDAGDDVSYFLLNLRVGARY